MAPSDNWLLNAVWSITPTLIVGLIFFGVVWAIVRADRAERRAAERIEAQMRRDLLLRDSDSSP